MLSTFSILIVLLIFFGLAQEPSVLSPHPYSPQIFLDAAQSVLDVGRLNEPPPNDSSFPYFCNDHEDEDNTNFDLQSISKIEHACELHRYSLHLAAAFNVLETDHNDSDSDKTRCNQVEQIQLRQEDKQFKQSLFQTPEASTDSNTKPIPPWLHLCDLARMMDLNVIQLDMLITELSHTFDVQYHKQALLLMTETDNFFRVVQAQGACGSNSISEFHENAPQNITKVIIHMIRMTNVLIPGIHPCHA